MHTRVTSAALASVATPRPFPSPRLYFNTAPGISTLVTHDERGTQRTSSRHCAGLSQTLHYMACPQLPGHRTLTASVSLPCSLLFPLPPSSSSSSLSPFVPLFSLVFLSAVRIQAPKLALIPLTRHQHPTALSIHVGCQCREPGWQTQTNGVRPEFTAQGKGSQGG